MRRQLSVLFFLLGAVLLLGTNRATAVECDPAVDLTGYFLFPFEGGPSEAVITNNSTVCSYPVGLAAYRVFSNGPDQVETQELHSFDQLTVEPESQVVLKVNKPKCAYQIYLFYGPLVPSFAGGACYCEREIDSFLWTGCPLCETSSSSSSTSSSNSTSSSSSSSSSANSSDTSSSTTSTASSSVTSEGSSSSSQSSMGQSSSAQTSSAQSSSVQSSSVQSSLMQSSSMQSTSAQTSSVPFSSVTTSSSSVSSAISSAVSSAVTSSIASSSETSSTGSTSSEGVFDCAGVANGIAKVDRCGICNGDGTSCLPNCSPVEISGQQIVLDSNAQFAKDATVMVVNLFLQTAGSSRKNRAFAELVLQNANTLYQYAWTTTYSLQASQLLCGESVFCNTFSNTPSFESYRAAFRQMVLLIDLTAKKVSKRRKAQFRFAQRLVQAVKDVEQTSLNVLAALPATTSECTVPLTQ